MSKCRYDLTLECNNKDCVECILNKIRVEIEQAAIKQTSGFGPKYIGVDRVNQIINKYKIEKENI